MTEPDLWGLLGYRVGSLSPVYKYLHRDHAKGFLDEGRVRVGTLDYYRSIENGRRGDPADARPVFTAEPRGEYNQDRPLPDGMQIRMAEGASAHFEPGITVRQIERYPNCYVWCSSRELSRSAADKSTACVQITDPEGFADVLTRALHTHLGEHLRCTHRPVMYRPGEMPFEERSQVHAAFFKDADKFSFENEYRMIWEAGAPPTQDFYDLTVLALRQFVRPVDIPPAP